MSRKITIFYAMLIAVASLAVGMVIASRLDLSPTSSAQTLAIPQTNSGPLNGPLDAATFRNIAKAQNGVVVNIRTEQRRRTQDLTDFFGGGSGGGGNDLFHRFFGMPDDQGGQGGQGRGPGGGRQGQGQGQREQVLESAGSGFIISKDGFILTNNHVIEGASVIKVALYSEDAFDTTELDAKVVGRDPLTDSALIQLVGKPPRPLPEAKFGDSSQMQPGDWVLAIGNPFELSHTVSVGVISANRPSGLRVTEGRSQDVLQTDAAINPGNSGGPLLNVRGEVIGINTAILSSGGGAGNVGIGFAIPINVVRDILPQLRNGKVVRGRMDVQLGPDIPPDATTQFGLKPGMRGAIVSIVGANGPGAKAGLQPGDVIVDYNGQPIKNRDQLIRLVIATKPGTTVPMRVLRDKQEKLLNITIEELDLEAETGTTPKPEEPQPEESSTTVWGMRLGNVTPDIARRLRLPSGRTGAVIMDVDPYSAADRSQLSPGDVILEINRTPVKDRAQAIQLLQKVPDGTRVGFLLWRGGQETFVLGRKEQRLGQVGRVGRVGWPPTALPASPPAQPAPPASPAQAMPTSCHALLLQRIRTHGPLTFEQFMEVALYDPGFGYYASAAKRSGGAGDFYTSVDVGPAFGELLAAKFADLLRAGGREPGAMPASEADVTGERTFDLVEAAAGNGRLTRDVLSGLETQAPALYAAARVHLVERSAVARASQRETLGRHAPKLSSSSEELPAAITGLVFANELLDALPTHAVVARPDGLREIWIEAAGDDLVEREGPLSTPEIAQYFERLGMELQPGWRAEVNLRAVDWVRRAARALHGGFLVLIDYGHEAGVLYSASHAQGTLATFTRHVVETRDARRPPWLRSPGTTDITAHVDLTSIRLAAESEGLTCAVLSDQMHFFLGLDLEARLGATGDPGDDLARRLAVKTLLMPGGLGTTHHVLVFARNAAAL